MENPFDSTVVVKPVEKKEQESAVEKMRSKRVSGFMARKSSKTQRRFAAQQNIFSK